MNIEDILTKKLITLIDDLRFAGYNIGATQYIAAQDLVLALAARGELPSDLSELRMLLAPILCHSPQEQAEFDTYFDKWVGQFQQVEIVVETETHIDNSGNNIRDLNLSGLVVSIFKNIRLWKWTVLIIVLLSGIYWVNTTYFPKDEEVPKPTQPSNITQPVQPNIDETVQPVQPALENEEVIQLPDVPVIPAVWDKLPPAEFLLLVPLLWFLWWWYRIQLFLTRQSTKEPPDVKNLPVQAIENTFFKSVSLARTSQQLRKHISVPANFLDVDATVAKTIQAGWFTPITGTIKIRPEYLALIDRTTFNDHQTQLVNSLINQIVADEVSVIRYYFDTVPRRLYPDLSGFGNLTGLKPVPLTLSELAQHYPNHRLLIFSDGNGLVNPITGQVVNWIEQFSWSQKALLTLESPEQWGYQEQILAGADFLILPANEAGLQGLVGQTDIWQPTDSGEFPEYLQERPRRWLEHHAPDAAVLTELLEQVRDFLGEKGNYWFSACAIYPELRWQLTLYLGEQLGLLTEERLGLLARLPWFRYGYMPDWLRERLIWDLSLEQEKAIRLSLQDLLLTAQDKPRSDFELQIVTKFPSLIKRLFGAKSKPLRDYVFLSFVGDRLAVKVPKMMRELIEPSNLLRLPSYLTVGLFVVFLVVVEASYNRLQFEPKGWNQVDLLPVKPAKEVKIEVFQDRLKDGGLGPKMVWIPAGSFRMGDIQGGGYDNEKPVHEVNIDYQFAMGQFEVTVEEYLRFAEATGGNFPEWLEEGNQYNIKTGTDDYYKKLGTALTDENHPIVGISWDNAVAYTKWLSKQTGREYRLPSEAEWEYAARAGTETKYWWGDDIGKNNANCSDDYCGDKFEYTSSIGSFKVNQFGLYDTAGNIWEWCADGWHDNYKNAPIDGSVWKKDNEYRVLRGGSWYTYDNSVRAAYRDGPFRVSRDYIYGFRVVGLFLLF
ncbi:formylglycine-generating enzyme family protein [Candidatus Halobeggiatoa sp. HSG11]|nr:formylglycine-generating enzyme family protein [Candidatus Halobeggiatoa sp. HSG11]